MPQYPNWSDYIHRTELFRVPEVSGVYKLFWIYGNTEVVQFIGLSNNLHRRINERTYFRWWNFAKFSETRGMRRNERMDLEYRLIARNYPAYNRY